ncbi:MAG: ribbon-helix-helix domain-containing protein [Candidatus Bathyarchaeia archaeon]|nr:ribbon-helix-helix protein, CopG family [Candidatus Bathyarchaeota archaeon]
MKLVSIYIPEAYIKALDRLVELKLYPNRAEAIRFAIRDLILRELPLEARFEEEILW